MSEKRNTNQLDEEQLDLMLSFLRFGGGQKSNVPLLKENLDLLRQMLIQKTAGQRPYAKKDDVPFEDLVTIVSCIVIEAMQLYLSGDLDLIEKLKGESE